MIARQTQGKAYKQDVTKISERYEGIPEHNHSQYAIFASDPRHNGNRTAMDEDEMDEEGDDNHNNSNVVHVTLLPAPFGVQSFQQPSRVHTMSMTEAEQAIEDQRSNTTRYMMHQRSSPGMMLPGSSNSAGTGSKARLLGRLKAVNKRKSDADGNDDDDDDVMGDIKFESRKGSNSRARKELLSSLGDGVAVDADGVLGGGNDAVFGGRRRFTKLNVQQESASRKKDKADETRSNAAAMSNDGMAMSDDFYQRDVKAEYDELDYDANEQFDDDDVDLGEGEVAVEGGFAEELEDDDDDDEEDEGEDDQKGEGFASVKGLKDMLAKARGETPADANKEAEAKEGDDKKTARPLSPGPGVAPDKPGVLPDPKGVVDGAAKNAATATNGENKNLAQVMAAAERSRDASFKKEQKKIESVSAKPVGVQMDERGQRILSLEAVRYEIFLHNKSIQTKKLMKIFSIKKKAARERIQTFQSIIKELCIMKKDPVQGNLLVLKQHYAK